MNSNLDLLSVYVVCLLILSCYTATVVNSYKARATNSIFYPTTIIPAFAATNTMSSLGILAVGAGIASIFVYILQANVDGLTRAYSTGVLTLLLLSSFGSAVSHWSSRLVGFMTFRQAFTTQAFIATGSIFLYTTFALFISFLWKGSRHAEETIGLLYTAIGTTLILALGSSLVALRSRKFLKVGALDRVNLRHPSPAEFGRRSFLAAAVILIAATVGSFAFKHQTVPPAASQDPIPIVYLVGAAALLGLLSTLFNRWYDLEPILSFQIDIVPEITVPRASLSLAWCTSCCILTALLPYINIYTSFIGALGAVGGVYFQKQKILDMASPSHIHGYDIDERYQKPLHQSEVSVCLCAFCLLLHAYGLFLAERSVVWIVATGLLAASFIAFRALHSLENA